VGIFGAEPWTEAMRTQIQADAGIKAVDIYGLSEVMGPGVASVKSGDRVAYLTRAYGGYASHRLIDADILVRIPEGIDDRVVGALFLRGLTAIMLVDQVFPVRAGHTVLVHAAAGGVGRLVCQLAKHAGATVIGTAGSETKAEIARAAGCDHTILYRSENFVERIRELTGGRGVDVAYDAVGKDTFQGSLESLAMRGHLVNYGQASGPIAPFEISQLFAKSNSVSRPAVFHYFVGRVVEVNHRGVCIEQWNNAKKLRTFFFVDHIVSISEEEILDPSNPKDREIIEEYKKVNDDSAKTVAQTVENAQKQKYIDLEGLQGLVKGSSR
jgi:NADPH:quinone reductase-like Zn-dependent oxidoreductase